MQEEFVGLQYAVGLRDVGKSARCLVAQAFNILQLFQVVRRYNAVCKSYEGPLRSGSGL
jgi:hypothetical protein